MSSLTVEASCVCAYMPAMRALCKGPSFSHLSPLPAVPSLPHELHGASYCANVADSTCTNSAPLLEFRVEVVMQFFADDEPYDFRGSILLLVRKLHSMPSQSMSVFAHTVYAVWFQCRIVACSLARHLPT